MTTENEPEVAETEVVEASTVLTPRRPAGRPPKEKSVKEREEDERDQAIAEFVKTDSIAQSINAQEPSLARLRRIQHEITRESAVIQYERIEQGRSKKPMSVLAMRRIEALTRLANIELKIRELDMQSVSLSNEKMQKLFEFWSLKVMEAGKAVLPEEMLKLFLNKWGTSMEHWEEEAENVLR